MHLVKLIRKNMRKIMVFVIIAIMGAFVLGSGLQYLSKSLFDPNKRVIATYDDGKKIRISDSRVAQNELGVLRVLMADRLLMAQSSSGMTGPLLVHLLFPDSPFSAQVATQMKQAVQQGQLPISQDELNDFFQQRPERPEILWLLLKDEAYRAGCVISNDTAAQTLRYIVPQMTNNQLDAAGLVNQIIARNNISEEQILRILSDLMSIMGYAEKVMDSQAVTINQVKASLGRSKEGIDTEFIKIEAMPLIDENADIPDARIQQQFDTYKASVPNDPTDDNPFGFGYKLGKRVQLEYMVVLTKDVKKQIQKPTAEALEEYYSSNIAKYQTSEPTDPNNPESEKIVKTRSFAEAEVEIRRAIETEKALTQANILFNEIKDKTENGFETLNFDESTEAELQKAAGDYVAIAGELSQKYNVPISVGKTGWLDASAFGQDSILSKIALTRGQNTLLANELAFAATKEKSQRQLIGVPSVRVWENIGPLTGPVFNYRGQYFVQKDYMAMIRVVGIKEAAPPEDVNATFDTKGIVLDGQSAQDDTTFSLAEQVKNDIRLLVAMGAAKARADEFTALIDGENWAEAVKAYNSKYAKDAEDEQRVELRGFKHQLRISHAQLELAKQFMLQNPTSAQSLRQRIISNMLTNRFYALLPEDAKTTGIIKTVLPFEPERACYVVKEVVRQPATTTDYLDNKAQTALQLNASESAGLALIHFAPENILERLGYQLKQQQEPDDQPTEAAVTENEEN